MLQKTDNNAYYSVAKIKFSIKTMFANATMDSKRETHPAYAKE